MIRKHALLLAFPLLIVLAGTTWMAAATETFEKATGRAFYGLAGNHYSVPDWGFAYHPGGKQIERWTVSIPPAATLAALVVSAILFSVARRRDGFWSVVLVWLYHLVLASLFLLVAAWYWINVMGVFI